ELEPRDQIVRARLNCNGKSNLPGAGSEREVVEVGGLPDDPRGAYRGAGDGQWRCRGDRHVGWSWPIPKSVYGAGDYRHIVLIGRPGRGCTVPPPAQGRPVVTAVAHDRGSAVARTRVICCDQIPVAVVLALVQETEAMPRLMGGALRCVF